MSYNCTVCTQNHTYSKLSLYGHIMQNEFEKIDECVRNLTWIVAISLCFSPPWTLGWKLPGSKLRRSDLWRSWCVEPWSGPGCQNMPERTYSFEYLLILCRLFEPACCMICICVIEEKTSRSRRFCWQMTPDRRANGRSPLATWLRCLPQRLHSIPNVRWFNFSSFSGLSMAPSQEKVLWVLSSMETWLMMLLEFRVSVLFYLQFLLWFERHVLLPGRRLGGLFHGT